MGWKLLDENPLWVLPSLAVEIGLNEAIVLQHLYYRCQVGEVKDEKRWVQASAEILQLAFPFWSASTIERTVKALKDGGYIEARRSRDGNLFTVDTPRTRQIDGSGTRQIDPSAPSDRRFETRQNDGSPSIRGEGKENQEELFAGEPAVENQDDQVVSQVWTHYLALFGDRLRVKDVTPPRRRMILKAWKAVGENVETLKAAITGLKSWRSSHPDGSQDVALSVIFETGPHSQRNLTDQISWWAEQGGDGALKVDPLAHVPDPQKHIVRERIVSANRYINGDQRISQALKDEGAANVQWLAENYSLAGTKQNDGTIKWEKTG